MNKTEERLNRWCSGEGIDFVDDGAEAQYKRKARRVADTVLLKTPDRVPVELSFGVFPALTSGITAKDIFFNGGKIVCRLQKDNSCPGCRYLQARNGHGAVSGDRGLEADPPSGQGHPGGKQPAMGRI